MCRAAASLLEWSGCWADSACVANPPRTRLSAGHARAYVAFDVLYRYLQHLGYGVTYVRNFTGGGAGPCRVCAACMAQCARIQALCVSACARIRAVCVCILFWGEMDSTSLREHGSACLARCHPLAVHYQLPTQFECCSYCPRCGRQDHQPCQRHRRGPASAESALHPGVPCRHGAEVLGSMRIHAGIHLGSCG